MESKKIFWWGENGTMNKQNTPVKLNWNEKAPEVAQSQNIQPLRIQSTWSKSMSFLYVTMADVSQLNENYTTKHRTLNKISEKWSVLGFK